MREGPPLPSDPKRMSKKQVSNLSAFNNLVYRVPKSMLSSRTCLLMLRRPLTPSTPTKCCGLKPTQAHASNYHRIAVRISSAYSHIVHWAVRPYICLVHGKEHDEQHEPGESRRPPRTGCGCEHRLTGRRRVS